MARLRPPPPPQARGESPGLNGRPRPVSPVSHPRRLEEARPTDPGRHARSPLVVLCPGHPGGLARYGARLPRSLEHLESLGGG
eukprot:14573766-Alexandrium_andersonii.AAC.1